MSVSDRQYVPEWLARRAADHPDSPAVIEAGGGVRWTYAELDRCADAVTCRLHEAGVSRGDRVAALLTNGAPYVALVHGLTRLGAVLVPLNLRLAPPELGRQIAVSGACILVHDDRTLEQARSIELSAAPPPFFAIADALKPPERAVVPGESPRIDLLQPQCVMFTSGTTGQSRGVLLSYGNHWWSGMASALNLGLHGDDRWLVCLPLFHVGGLAMLFRAVIYGIPLVFPPVDPGGAGFDPTSASRAMTEHGVTIVSVVTVMLRRLLDHWAGGAHPPALRCVLLGGGPAPLSILEECAARRLPVVQSYGMTETASQVVALSPADALRKLGSAGRPLLTNELRIAPLDAEFEKAQAGAGVEGEIWVRGPSVTTGYLPEDGDFSHLLPAADGDGWLHTGDIGRLDDEGYLYVLDRRADLIISGGENISPAEIEAVLLTHPDLVEAAVYGIADARWGQCVVAAIVPRSGVTIDSAGLRDFCRARLAGYKTPTRIRIVATLPRNAAGKVLRRQLRAEAEGMAISTASDASGAASG
jgi:O-succinylbenzoic acid--CoA ligase